jgi:hypothetical protein
MRTFNNSHRVIALGLAIVAIASGAACERDKPSGQAATAIADAPDLPPVYTTQQCVDLVTQFPGWSNVTPVPESDPNGVPTVFYAVIAITDPQQIPALNAMDVYTDSMPIFMDRTTRGNYDGKVGYVSKSTCGGAEIVWALMPGPVFNRIAQDTVKFNEMFVEAVVLLSVPDAAADTSVTYNGLHPVSTAALRAGGFNAPQAAPAPQGSGNTVAVAGIWDDIKGAYNYVTGEGKNLAKDVVNDAVSVGDWIKNHWQSGAGWVACQWDGCVNATVHVDVLNADPAFGAQSLASGGAGATPMIRAWGDHAGDPIQISGVTLSARQTFGSGFLSTGIRHDGTIDPTGSARVQVVKGKSTDFCLTLGNSAATLNDWFNARELCSFSKALTDDAGDALAGTTFERDGDVHLRVQDKYVNVMAQLTDGYDYLQQIVGYTPRQAKVLSGPPLNVPGIKQLIGSRAITACLNFPNVVVDGVNTLLNSVAEELPPPFDLLGFLFAGAVENIYEDDMWLPDSGNILTSRGVASHEYGHFAMCSLLYDEDWTKMVLIPSLIIQRAAEGTYGDATDEAAYIMEGWADFFAGQTANGANYFAMENEIGQETSMAYCRGDSASGPCWDWNYVEDLDSTMVGSVGSYGFLHQVRRVATTLSDAFDGHAFGTNMPGNGDFWTQQDGRGFVVQAATHTGDAKDENVTLAGPEIRELIHNWTHAPSLPVTWGVTQQQFFGALNATIRGATVAPIFPIHNYGWCDACKLFAQHDSMSCTVTGNASASGVCVAAGNAPTEPQMSIQQMVSVCEQSPTIPGFIGAAPTTDPSAPCTFTGCAPHTVLVGQVGDLGAACTTCGAHQVATGSRSCPATECPVANSSGTTCVACPDAQVVGGPDGNTCVACPALQVPNAARGACVPCGPHQIASGTICVDCPNSEIAMPDNTCQACPDGQVPYSNQGLIGSPPTYGESCLPAAECTCTASYCRTLNSVGICMDIIG